MRKRYWTSVLTPQPSLVAAGILDKPHVAQIMQWIKHLENGICIKTLKPHMKNLVKEFVEHMSLKMLSDCRYSRTYHVNLETPYSLSTLSSVVRATDVVTLWDLAQLQQSRFWGHSVNHFITNCLLHNVITLSPDLRNNRITLLTFIVWSFRTLRYQEMKSCEAFPPLL